MRISRRTIWRPSSMLLCVRMPDEESLSNSVSAPKHTVRVIRRSIAEYDRVLVPNHHRISLDAGGAEFLWLGFGGLKTDHGPAPTQLRVETRELGAPSSSHENGKTAGENMLHCISSAGVKLHRDRVGPDSIRQIALPCAAEKVRYIRGRGRMCDLRLRTCRLFGRWDCSEQECRSQDRSHMSEPSTPDR